MQIESVGRRHILLTSEELQCFEVVRYYQRKVLVSKLIKSDFEAIKRSISHVGWSGTPLVLVAQWVVLILIMPFLLLWLLIRFLVASVLFPFRYFQTYLIPKDLAAPGEKSLAGVHNAFSRYMNLDVASYVDCANEWVRILYGDEALKNFNLNDLLTEEIQRLGIGDAAKNEQKKLFTPEVRTLLAASREKLSRELGHYFKGDDRTDKTEAKY